ncbi:hypothetical protein M413DRAFT_445170 [Hebeloma cylindrosporum]|uniref:Tetrapyrrole biosynthesis uroporphyrinogen III synthase domain-containing protein n=1 Tax=Hebeloma cylindrosporum TaxID=76867 RepID=A0A0C3CEC0_HEBCY|nr:hypothetical protein M413DRAFT_445170 [Hebeloma cylindrosporum h7]
MALGLLKEGGQHEESVAGWLRIPFYVVGHGTATALQDAFDFFPTKVDIDIRGESSGNAVTLAPFMLSDIKERPAKILYLTGDKNRDTLTNLLTEGGITLEPLQVYETLGSPRFEEQLLRVLRSPSEEHPPSSWWVAHFAPSAAAFASPILQRYFDFEENLPSTSTLRSDSSDAIPTQAKPAVTTKNSRRAKVAAIGPTTNAFLLDDLGIRVHAMAHKPTPEEILAVIAASDRKTSEL